MPPMDATTGAAGTSGGATTDMPPPPPMDATTGAAGTAGGATTDMPPPPPMDTTTGGDATTAGDLPPPTDDWVEPEWNCETWARDMLFHAADADGDWELSSDEFWDVMDNVWVDRSGPLSESLTEDMHAGIEAFFADGKVDKDSAMEGFGMLLDAFEVTDQDERCEILDFMSAQIWDWLPSHEEMVDMIHFAIDDNMDGVIDQAEVDDVVSKVAQSPEEEADIRGFFEAAAAKDPNGEITAAAAGEAVYEQYAEELDPLLADLDAAEAALERVAIPAWFDIKDIADQVEDAGEWDDQDWEQYW